MVLGFLNSKRDKFWGIDRKLGRNLAILKHGTVEAGMVSVDYPGLEIAYLIMVILTSLVFKLAVSMDNNIPTQSILCCNKYSYTVKLFG